MIDGAEKLTIEVLVFKHSIIAMTSLPLFYPISYQPCHIEQWYMPEPANGR
jgi:hypothetical protein